MYVTICILLTSVAKDEYKAIRCTNTLKKNEPSGQNITYKNLNNTFQSLF